MIKVGIGLPGITVADVQHSAEAASAYSFDSFSVYGDLGDLPPYAVLHASAHLLQHSGIPHVGPMGIAVGLQHPERIASDALALEEQLPGTSSIGLVKGAFLDTIGQKPATLADLEHTIDYIRQTFADRSQETPPIYIGGFGPKLLGLAGNLSVRGVKLGGSTNGLLAERTRQLINNPEVEIVLGAVSVIDRDRKAARALARNEVAKYIAVVGALDPTLDEAEKDSLNRFMRAFRAKDSHAPGMISDALLDKFSLAGTPEDALHALKKMGNSADRFEFGTPHGFGERADAIRHIGETIVKELV